MKIDNLNILEQIERLGAAFPWDDVQLWIARRPEGTLGFTAYLPAKDKLGFESAFGNGSSPVEAADQIIKQNQHLRDPELARRTKIEELKETIRKLEAVKISIPPYRPNRELAAGCVPVPDPVVEV